MKQNTIAQNIVRVQEKIKLVADRAQRNPLDVRLVAVSKTRSAEEVLSAVRAGVTRFGENYIQEAVSKIETLKEYELEWHFIGHLQSNKARFAVAHFDLIHSVDRLKLARELDRQAQKIGKIQPILVQVNLSMEESKSGVEEQNAEKLIRAISQLEQLSIKGVMTLPPFYNDPDAARPWFSSLNRLAKRIEALGIEGVSMTERSMGMTGDFTAAILEGATLVRIGTAIFGRRQ